MGIVKPGFLALIVVILIGLVGCAPHYHLYAGEPRPEEQLYSVVISGGDRTNVEAFRVDNHNLEVNARAFLLPGYHRVEVDFTGSVDSAEASISIGKSIIATVPKVHCSVTINGSAGQRLFVYPYAGESSLLGGSKSPTITVKESGLFSPVLFSGLCHTVGSRVGVEF